MTYCFYICTFLFFIILQTAILPYFPLFDRFYDLLSPFVIYLGLFRPARESILVIAVIGFVMDHLSGSPLGLYLTTYLWLFVGVRWLVTVLHVRDRVLLPFVVAVGVLLQNIIFMGIVSMFEPGSRFSSAAFRIVVVQVLWAIGTGPFILIFINYLHQRWDKWSSEVLTPSESNR